MSSRTALVSPLCGGTESQAGKAVQTRWSSSRATPPRPASAASKPDKISISAAQVAKRPSTAATQHRHRQQRQELGAGVAGPGRPTSARTQRPLSGNVYLKKTVKNGWVACSVHDEEEEWGEEGEEDEWEEDEVGCAWGSETLLDGLLRSKKLMNSKRVQHMDWTAGEVAIPEFHCQRCRDHWYGLTHYPCDEELARLIRQGLWTTGQGPVDRDLLLGGRGSLAARDRRHMLKEGGARGGDKLNLPPIVDRTNSDSSLDGSRSGGGRSDGKKGRRITFNMQAEEFVYSREGEEAVTDGRGSSKGRVGQTGEREEPEGSAHQTGPGSSQSLSRNVGKSTREEAGSGERVPDGMSLHQKEDYPWQGGPPSDVGGGIPKEREQHRSKQTGSTSSHGDSSGRGSSMSNVNRHPSYSGASSEDISKFGEGYGRGGAHMGGGKTLSRGAEGGVWRKEDGGPLATGGSLTGTSTADASSATADSRSTMGAGGQGHHGDRGGSHWGRGSDSGEESGDEGGGVWTKPTTTNSDAGKNVRVQGAGFIARASSPTGSEWGDPTHALMFISNTACSSRAGSSLGGRVQSDELGKTHSDPVLLQARPKLTAGDFVWGPPLTRAFTFSYHRRLAPTSQQTAANRSATKPTKRRK